MHRPWQIWTTFAACLLLLVAAVAWLSAKALESDEAEAAARRQAALEENARLALWRMDTLLAPLIAQEGAIPFAEYVTFHADPANAEPPVKPTVKTPSELTARPSVLLTARDPFVQLHFQVSNFPPQPADPLARTLDEVEVTSPEVPCDQALEIAVPRWISVADYRRNEQLLTGLDHRLSTAQFSEWVAQLPAVSPTNSQYLAANALNQPQAPTYIAPRNGPDALPDDLFEPNLPPAPQPNIPGDAGPPQSAAPQQANSRAQSPVPQTAAVQQATRSQSEYQARQRFVENNRALGQSYQMNNGAPIGEEPNAFVLPLAGQVTTSVMKPLWIGADLVLARAVANGNPVVAQGALLDWPRLKLRLLAEVTDLLPRADLIPATVKPGGVTSNASGEGETRLLASLPVRLSTGDLPLATSASWSAVRYSLLVAWSAIALATVAVALVLRGVLSLSERRAAFVSAVTHELRTPLTTFRMYAEMLSEDMVPDETARRGYLHTLKVEAERLTHLVANVLAYARLERGALTGRIERITVERLLEVATHRLTERAAQAGFTIEVDAGPVTRASAALADPSAVEQILFNLVDNACKYAADAQDKTLRLTANKQTPTSSPIEIRLADRGPGVAPAAQRKLFQAFRKSAQDAAHSAPGVGLGLALSRRLARELGGDLRYEPTADGACFVLTLRAAT
jgi:signal transduction histidine kinase